MNNEWNQDMVITLTESAAKQIHQQLEKRGKGLALRISIKKVGCSGFAYTFDYADEFLANDRVFGSYNASVVIDMTDLPFFNGSSIDFIKEGLNSSFKLNNPNVDSACGCGESFSLKDLIKA